MKRLFLMLLSLIIVFSFSCCRPRTVYLPDDELEELYKNNSSYSGYPHPAAEDITGVYLLEGTDGYTDNTEWKARVSKTKGKFVLQVYLPDSEIVDLTDEALSKLKTSYDEKTGHYTQVYDTPDYISTYEAYFYIEDDGKIRITAYNRYANAGDRAVNQGVYASGCKIEGGSR